MPNIEAPAEAGFYFVRLAPMHQQQDGAIAVVVVEGLAPWLEIGAALELTTGEIWERGQLSLSDIESWGDRVHAPVNL